MRLFLSKKLDFFKNYSSFSDVSSSEKAIFDSQWYLSWYFLALECFKPALFEPLVVRRFGLWAVPGLFAYMSSLAGFRASLSSYFFYNTSVAKSIAVHSGRLVLIPSVSAVTPKFEFETSEALVRRVPTCDHLELKNGEQKEQSVKVEQRKQEWDAKLSPMTSSNGFVSPGTPNGGANPIFPLSKVSCAQVLNGIYQITVEDGF